VSSLQGKLELFPTRGANFYLLKMFQVTSSAPRKADCRIVRASGGRVVRRNAVSAPGFDAKSSSVVTMRSNWTKTSKLDGIKRDAVDHYIRNAQKYLKRLQLPLGAKLQPVDTESQPPKWELQLPELRFVSVAIRYGRKTSPSAIPQACR
jgi:hypothetical protein